MSRITIIGGDFDPHPRTRFQQATLILFKRQADTVDEIRYPPKQLSEFRVFDGAWERCLGDTAGWAHALTAAAGAGAAPAVANAFLPQFFMGQRALVTWLNAVVGGVAAVSALQSHRQVRFRARFRDGANLEARVQERALTLRLPSLLTAALVNPR